MINSAFTAVFNGLVGIFSYREFNLVMALNENLVSLTQMTLNLASLTFVIDQSRKCPLCAADIGRYVIHSIRSELDYQKYYLPPLIIPSDTPRALALQSHVEANVRRRRRRPAVQWGGRRDLDRDDREDASNALDRAIEKRRWVYRNKLYAKVRFSSLVSSLV